MIPINVTHLLWPVERLSICAHQTNSLKWQKPNLTRKSLKRISIKLTYLIRWRMLNKLSNFRKKKNGETMKSRNKIGFKERGVSGMGMDIKLYRVRTAIKLKLWGVNITDILHLLGSMDNPLVNIIRPLDRHTHGPNLLHNCWPSLIHNLIT